MTLSIESDSTTRAKAPLSAYNMFFQLERKRILSGKDRLQMPITRQEVQATCREHRTKQNQVKPRRVHRRTHGKIGFADLARTIAARWRALDDHSLFLLKSQAALEKKEYIKNEQLQDNRGVRRRKQEHGPRQDLLQNMRTTNQATSSLSCSKLSGEDEPDQRKSPSMIDPLIPEYSIAVHAEAHQSIPVPESESLATIQFDDPLLGKVPPVVSKTVPVADLSRFHQKQKEHPARDPWKDALYWFASPATSLSLELHDLSAPLDPDVMDHLFE